MVVKYGGSILIILSILGIEILVKNTKDGLSIILVKKTARISILSILSI